jgi:hypothetical protein
MIIQLASRLLLLHSNSFPYCLKLANGSHLCHESDSPVCLLKNLVFACSGCNTRNQSSQSLVLQVDGCIIGDTDLELSQLFISFLL